MALGRPIPLLQLSRKERETLQRWVRRPRSAQALCLRARIGSAIPLRRGSFLGGSNRGAWRWTLVRVGCQRQGAGSEIKR